MLNVDILPVAYSVLGCTVETEPQVFNGTPFCVEESVLNSSRQYWKF